MPLTFNRDSLRGLLPPRRTKVQPPDVKNGTSWPENRLSTTGNRVLQFHEELKNGSIDIHRVRRLAFHGVPDADNLRAVVWKLLLGYLPLERNHWEEELQRKREQYRQFCEELILDPKTFAASANTALEDSFLEVDQAAAGSGADLSLARADVTHYDHPLNQKKDSKWNTYFKDSEVLEQIERDVLRTHPDMHFFSGQGGDAAQHREEMKRALFVFAKLNPGLTYVQGMNELYAPLYYLFRTDATPGARRHAEADAFFCFVDLISEFRDNFCQQLDNSRLGIRAGLTHFSELLKGLDEPLWQHLEECKVKPQFYAFRWIMLLLTQEFPFPDVLRLWDTLLSDRRGRLDCLLRMCLALLLHIREQLLQADFSAVVKLLQRYPPVDVQIILQRAALIELPPF